MNGLCLVPVILALPLAPPESASAWQSISFTAPDGNAGFGAPQQVARYRLFQRDEFMYDSERTLFAGPDVSSGEPAPKVPGQPETIWFSLSEDARPRMYRLCSEDSAGNRSDYSNAVVMLTPALAETAYIDLTGTNDLITGKLFVQSRPAPASPGKWFVSWTRAPGDSSLAILPHWRTSLLTSSPMLSLRRFQTLDAPAACAVGKLFGWPFYAEAGQWRDCP